MSIISSITGSLPNPLNLFQGTWEIQYKNKYVVEAPKQDTSKNEDGTEKEGLDAGMSAIKDFTVNAINSKLADPWQTLPFDSIISVNEVENTNIVNQPIEKGSFRSINKVKLPKEFNVVAATGGISYGIEESLSILKELLPLSRIAVAQNITLTDIGNVYDAYAAGNAVTTEQAQSSLDFLGKMMVSRTIPMEFRIVTPHDMTEKLNLVKFDYIFKRETGRNMLIVNMKFQEILENDKTAEDMELEKIKINSDSKKKLNWVVQSAGLKI